MSTYSMYGNPRYQRVNGVYQRLTNRKYRRTAADFAPETLAKARDFEQTFIDLFVPKITASCRRHLAFLRRHDLEDAVQGSLGWGWREVLTMIDAGRDPLSAIGCVIKHAVQKVKQFRAALAFDAREDVLSPRAQSLHDFGVCEFVEDRNDD